VAALLPHGGGGGGGRPHRRRGARMSPRSRASRKRGSKDERPSIWVIIAVVVIVLAFLARRLAAGM
jgi:hypothetical protein